MKKIEKLINSRRKKHFTLIDPAKRAVDAGKIQMLERYGTDAIMLGGSTDVRQKELDRTILLIKKHSKSLLRKLFLVDFLNAEAMEGNLWHGIFLLVM